MFTTKVKEEGDTMMADQLQKEKPQNTLKQKVDRPSNQQKAAAGPKQNSQPNPVALTEDQMDLVFEEILKLAADNKINKDNAWELNFMDVMPCMIRMDSSNGGVSFPKASAGLEACLKIYGSRVEQMYEMALSLGRLGDKKKGDGADEDGGETGNANESGDASRNRRKRGNAAEASDPGSTLARPEDLVAKETDLSFSSDPVYCRMSKMYDENSIQGLLSLNLGVGHGGRFMFNAEDVPMQSGNLEGVRNQDVDMQVDLSSLPNLPALMPLEHGLTSMGTGIQELYQLLGQTDVVDEFAALSIKDLAVQCGWGKGAPRTRPHPHTEIRSGTDHTASSDISADLSVGEGTAIKNERMSIDGAEPTLNDVSSTMNDVSSLHEGGSAVDNDNRDGDDFFAPDNYEDDDLGGMDEDDDDGSEGDGDDASMPGTSRRNTKSHQEVDQDADDLISQLAHSTGNQISGNSWAGAHFFKAAAKKAKGREAGTTKKPRGRAAAIVDMHAPLDIAAILPKKASQKEISLSSSSARKPVPMLPEEQYNVQSLFSLHHPGMKIIDLIRHRQRATLRKSFGLIRSEAQPLVPLQGADELSGYGGGQDNYGGDDNGDDYDDSAEFSAQDATLPDLPADCNPNEAAAALAQSLAMPLVPLPRKVRVEGINYSRAAKQVDVRALKHTLLDCLTTKRVKTPSRRLSKPTPEKRPAGASELTFQTLIADIPETSTVGARDDISVHLCFICLLHLANEHSLVLDNKGSLSQLAVSNLPVPV